MPTVLAADDSAMVRKVFERTFTDTDFELVALAKNGREAVDLYAQHRPDVVTLDITMPEMDGLEALEAIRALDPEARCLMVTALDQRHLMVKAVKAGACGYIVKPFQKEPLLEKLRSVVGGDGHA